MQSAPLLRQSKRKCSKAWLKFESDILVPAHYSDQIFVMIDISYGRVVDHMKWV